MGEVFFYHLTRFPLERALPQLVSGALDRGWRVVIRGRDEKMLDRLDEQLWMFPPESFLPHGRAGGSRDAEQPVLLTSAVDRPNRAECLVSIDGAEISDDDLSTLARICVVFDGGDQSVLQKARKQWLHVTGSGHVAKYWSRETGRWELKREAGG